MKHIGCQVNDLYYDLTGEADAAQISVGLTYFAQHYSF